jgi:hypothetical protein
MGIKFTVNGVVYNSVEAMPPEARQIYEKALAEVPDLADRDGDGIPDVAKNEGLSIKPRIIVRKKIVVNGVTYDNELAMPPEARAAFEKAMQAASTNPSVRKREIKLSFQVDGPGFKFHAGSGAPAAPAAPGSAAGGLTALRDIAPGATPRPIEPSRAGSVLRTGAILIALGLSAGVGLALYFWLRAR